MKNTIYNKNLKGLILPMTIVFMVISTGIIFSYFLWIGNKSVNLKYRIAAQQAYYNAITGVSERGFQLNTIATGDTVSEIEIDCDDFQLSTFKPNENGFFDNVSVAFSEDGNSRVIGARGTMMVNSFGGNKLIERFYNPVITPETLGKYMYLSDSDSAGGAPFSFDPPYTRRRVFFGNADAANGIIQSNGPIYMTETGQCPDFSEATLYITQGTELSLGNCNGMNDLFNTWDWDSQVDTFPPVNLPPSGYITLKNNATLVYDAGIKLGGGIKDTLIMTDIEFLANGYFNVKQWWYLMPPHLKPGISFSEMILPNPEHLDGIVVHPTNGNNYHDTNSNGVYNAGDAFENCDVLEECNAFQDSLKAYHGRWNGNSGGEEESSMIPYIRGQYGLRHFDFPILYPDGSYDQANNTENESIPNTDALLLNDVRYASGPTVIYIKNGPVRVHGIFNGRYTIVTDEHTEYRRHASSGLFGTKDTIWNDIWITGDLVNADAANTSPWPGILVDFQPDSVCSELGTDNIMGLVSGANVVIANTKPNGAQNNIWGDNISINAGIIALNESFVMHYWQNTTDSFTSQSGVTGSSSDPPWADGRGQIKFGDTNNTDFRGFIHLWGSIVQKYRGYMRRNPTSPYNAADIGMEKDYNYDENFLCSPPPFYPAVEYDDQMSFQLTGFK